MVPSHRITEPTHLPLLTPFYTRENISKGDMSHPLGKQRHKPDQTPPEVLTLPQLGIGFMASDTVALIGGQVP
jgi:hypothetical protein